MVKKIKILSIAVLALSAWSLDSFSFEISKADADPRSRVERSQRRHSSSYHRPMHRKAKKVVRRETRTIHHYYPVVRYAEPFCPFHGVYHDHHDHLHWGLSIHSDGHFHLGLGW